MVDKFCGTWECIETKDFAEYMAALGVPEQIIKNASITNPKTIFSKEGDKCIVKIEHGPPTMTNYEVTFKLGEEFEELTSDGRRCKTVVKLDRDRLVYTQRWDGDKESNAVRYIQDDKLFLELTTGSVKAVREYKKA